jgi:ABC-type dipeptide/oligopeptide/nickel transport system permease subunit
VALSFPFLLVVIAVHRAASSPGLAGLCALLGAFSWPALARVTRTKVMQIKEREFVQAARALGVSEPRILCAHPCRTCSAPPSCWARRWSPTC